MERCDLEVVPQAGVALMTSSSVIWETPFKSSLLRDSKDRLVAMLAWCPGVGQGSDILHNSKGHHTGYLLYAGS